MRKIMALTLAALCLAFPALAETATLRLGVQPGLTYLPFAVVQHEKLVEKMAARSGIGGLQVTYSKFAGGPAMNDALLSGAVDVAITGIPSFLTLWAKSRGQRAIRGLTSYGHIPIALVTRNPNVKTLTDFTDKDRIALPGVKTSLQAIFLAMAAEKLYGPGQSDRFNAITVTRAHPDGMAAILGNTEINSHFTIPPYLQIELKRPDIHLVATAVDIVGSPVSNGVVYLPERFYEANPKVVGALYEAIREAIALINADPVRAAEIYLSVSGERTPVDEIKAMITTPGAVYEVTPRGTMALARFLKRNGYIPAEPADWKELFLPFAHGEPGS
ncbi:MAG: ABC transporter substrate-binding protein [Acetobacteraceae bacterium]